MEENQIGVEFKFSVAQCAHALTGLPHIGNHTDFRHMWVAILEIGGVWDRMAKVGGEAHLVVGIELLVAEEQHTVGVERISQLRCRIALQRGGQIHATYMGAQGAAGGLNLNL
ncbi:MAG: hypothetical protein HC802_08790 [Caldilineaceae bacterium]|nr:hypothetical protein [Caldilineaceae bacterium]